MTAVVAVLAVAVTLLLVNISSEEDESAGSSPSSTSLAKTECPTGEKVVGRKTGADGQQQVVCATKAGGLRGLAEDVGLEVTDGSKDYLVLSTGSPNFNSSADVIELLVEKLGFSPAIESKIGHTRALDGTLTDESTDGKYEATWTYHPDDGLNITIERVG